MTHFCSCGDHKCPFNPHNPANEGKGCDLCVAKCLKRGEIPSCFFHAAGEGRRPEGGYTYRDFANFILENE